MQYKVPQNIDMEDRIVGPLTLIQFVYVIIGGMIDYILFSSMGTSPLFWLLAVPVSLIALAFAFLKIQDQPTLNFVFAAIQYLTRPKSRVWKHSQEQEKIIVQKSAEVKKSPAAPSLKVTRGRLKEIADDLDFSSQ